MSIETNIIRKVHHTLSKHRMIERGDRVIVAVSGGPDSVCLLDVLYRLRDDLGIVLVVAHFDHGLRPEEDERETLFVSSLARSLHIPFESGKAPADLSHNRASLEEAAREARYLFLERAMETHCAQKIALGHTLNDHAETVLMRLLRGSGPAGLSGIPPVRGGHIIRPLISVCREEVETYLRVRKLECMRDSSNIERRYLRNRVRLELLPELRKYQPRIVEILAQTAEILRQEDSWLSEVAEQWVNDEAGADEEGMLEVPLSSFLLLPGALRYRAVRALVGRAVGTLRRIKWNHVEAIDRLARSKRPQGQIHLPHRGIVRKIYDRLLFTVSEQEAPGDYEYSLDGPGVYYMEAVGLTMSIQELDRGSIRDLKAAPLEALLNGDRITYPLAVRNFRPGDRFVPLGMKGHRKVKDFFIDLKIPSRDRRRIPILTSQDKPIWICGYRIDDRFRVADDTTNVLRVKVERGRVGSGNREIGEF